MNQLYSHKPVIDLIARVFFVHMHEGQFSKKSFIRTVTSL